AGRRRLRGARRDLGRPGRRPRRGPGREGAPRPSPARVRAGGLMASSPLFRNLGTKILALAIAILLWFVFSAQQRERISERGYRIPLSVANVPASTIIASPLPATVEVRLRGPFTALRQLDPDRLEAVIDLTDAPRGEKIYRLAPEDVNVPREVEVIAMAPSEVRVELDASAEKSVPIAARLTGKPAAGAARAAAAREPRGP